MTRFRWGIALVLCLFLIVGAGYVWMARGAESGRYCVNCHEISPSHETWSSSAHRNMSCTGCHGTALSEGLHSMKEKAGMALSHLRRGQLEKIRMREDQVLAMIQRCRSCHQQQYADWTSSGHSLTYSDVFLNPAHNKVEQVNEDCLRCHGMFFAGNSADIVTPLDTRGPWKLQRPELSRRPAIPCLACHQIHSPGKPAAAPDYSNPKGIGQKREVFSTTTGFFDRREMSFYPMPELPDPHLIKDGVELPVAPDNRVRNCYQCHAPNAYHEAGSSDDRTPRGVHQGLSCFVCHKTHSLDARSSCSLCHPQMSNCGLDVTRMDTTFASSASFHNIHFMGCIDCHTKGVPAPKTKLKGKS
jgi:hypothetical protein